MTTMVLVYVGELYGVAERLLSGIEGCSWGVEIISTAHGIEVRLRARYRGVKWLLAVTERLIVNWGANDAARARDTERQVRVLKRRMLSGERVQ